MSDDVNIESAVLLEKYFTREERGPNDLMGTLKVRRSPGTMRLTVRSRKLGNCILNWKKFLFDVLPAAVGVATAIPHSAAVAALVGLRAVKAAADTLDIELPDEASDVVLRLADLQRDAENVPDLQAWVPINSVNEWARGRGVDDQHLNVILRDLERLRVLAFDVRDEKVRIVEEIAFVAEP